jgi:glucuronosyltransferase
MASITIVFILTALLLGVLQVEAKVVIMLSVPHIANVRTHTNVGRALAELGHQPYVLIPHFMMEEKLVNVEGVNVIVYGDYLGNYEEILSGKMIDKFWRREIEHLSDMLDVARVVQETVKQILSDKVLLDKIRAVKPELFLLSHVPPFKNIVILPYIFDVPFAFMSPFNDLQGYRVPVSPAATPCQMIGVVSPQSFLDRLKMTACNVVLLVVGLVSANDTMVTEFAPHRPRVSVNELALRAEIYLVEGDHILDFAKPELPNLKLIGCTAPGSGKPLKDPFKKFVEGSKQGVAVVTFGSSVVNIPVDVAQKMAAAFLQQDLDVVWRTNYTSTNPTKVFTSEWIPQNDILAHANTKLFVSHCGANGQYEALYHGVPMLCLPLFGDQTYNAKRSTAKGLGLDASILDISATQLAELMREVAGNVTYRTNMRKASILFGQLYKEPHKTAAFWIDHVMEYGGSYMRSAGQDMPLYQFYLLDVLLFVFLLSTTFLVCLYASCLCCCRVCRRFRAKGAASKKGKKD